MLPVLRFAQLLREIGPLLILFSAGGQSWSSTTNQAEFTVSKLNQGNGFHPWLVRLTELFAWMCRAFAGATSRPAQTSTTATWRGRRAHRAGMVFRNTADTVEARYVAGQKNPTIVMASAIRQDTRNHFLAQKYAKA